MKSIIRKKCVITGEKLSVLLKLGKFPLANDLKIKSNTEVDTYELTLCYSNKSNIVQINNIVNPEILFKKYLWVTGTSKKINTYWIERFIKYFKKLIHINLFSIKKLMQF